MLKISPDTCETTALFWDCECREAYIHPALELDCPRCQAMRDEQPDARIQEVMQHPRLILSALENAWQRLGIFPLQPLSN